MIAADVPPQIPQSQEVIETVIDSTEINNIIQRLLKYEAPPVDIAGNETGNNKDLVGKTISNATFHCMCEKDGDKVGCIDLGASSCLIDKRFPPKIQGRIHVILDNDPDNPDHIAVVQKYSAVECPKGIKVEKYLI